jgi:ParB-like chromosome segregation protein Spo0J
MIKNFKTIKTNQLIEANWNYKEDEPEKLEKLKNNIKRNGQIENIIVRELEDNIFEVVNGNHRLKAMKDLNIKEIIVYDLGKISLPKAKRIAVETNETKFRVNDVRLSEIIKELTQEFEMSELLETMPYTELEIQDLSQLVDFDFDMYNKKDDESDPDDNKTTKTELITCPHCGGQFNK